MVKDVFSRVVSIFSEILYSATLYSFVYSTDNCNPSPFVILLACAKNPTISSLVRKSDYPRHSASLNATDKRYSTKAHLSLNPSFIPLRRCHTSTLKRKVSLLFYRQVRTILRRSYSVSTESCKSYFAFFSFRDLSIFIVTHLFASVSIRLLISAALSRSCFFKIDSRLTEKNGKSDANTDLLVEAIPTSHRS